MNFFTTAARRCVLMSLMTALPVVSFGQTTLTRLPEVKVPIGQLGEEQLVGDNKQPEWTTERRFARVRVYVLEPGQAQVEQWWKGKYKRNGEEEHLSQTEVEFGLPHRLQLDLYENATKEDGKAWRHAGFQTELRYALAEWGKIPLNPTLYGEWKFNKFEPDTYEAKLLLATELAPRWHWGLNVAYEQEVSGGRNNAMAMSQAVGYTVQDMRLNIGVEMQVERASSPNYHGKPELEVLIGPSIQWRPKPRIHFDFVPLFGATNDSPRVVVYAILGVDFGKKSGEHFAPTSLRSR